MKKIPTITALVPMRHESQRVPGKNYRLLAGKPLYEHIISTLLDCPYIERVVVDTDSPVISDGLAREYPQVLVLERPEHLLSGEIPMNDVLLHDTVQVQADFYLQTHSTNPLLKTSTITSSIEAFLAAFPTYDSLFSVTRMQTRLWDELGRAINHNPNILMRTQDLPPVYEENSCLYIFSREILLQEHNRLGRRPLMFEIDPDEAWDIDEEFDFLIAEFLLQRQAQ